MTSGLFGLEGNFGYNFLLGVLATVNPCGFILLPTYLMFFLGVEGVRPGTQRASIARALAVGAAVSAGFFVVFLVIGVLFKAGVTWFTDQASWLSLVVGVLLVLFGIAWLFGFRPSVMVPRVEVGGTDRTVVSMFLYGITYAVASIGCTLPFFTSGILSTLSNNGVASGVAAIVVYGLGMGLMLTTLTVTLAFARTGLLDVMRSGMKYVEYFAPVFLILTGAYLIIYGRTGLTGNSSSTVDRVESIQTSVANWLNDFGAATLALVLGGVTVAALVFVVVRRDRHPSPRP
jgi:cytochrome c biogenesis protein CcdA